MSAEDIGKAFREDITRASQDLVVRIATILRTAYVHSANNEAWTPVVQALGRSLGRLLPVEGTTRVLVRHGRVVVNDHAVRPSFSEHGAHQSLAEELSKRHLAGLRFKAQPDPTEIIRFAYTLAELEEAQPITIIGMLSQRGVRSIEVIPAEDEQWGLEPGIRDRRGRALLLFLKGVSAVHEVLEGLRGGHSVGFRRLKRFAQDAIEFLAVQRGLALSLTALKNVGGYLENHAVNVCLHSILLGERLGFDRRRLCELAIAALVRDIGKAALPRDLLDKPGDLTPDEWDRFRKFPHVAVPTILRFRGFNEETLRQVLVAFEHQFKSNQDRTLTRREFSLFTRIVQIAGDYDAMTTPRPYRPTALTPHDALRMLVRDRFRTGADPVLLKGFLHSVGLYPVGSVVLLDTHELALVVEPPFDERALARPRVRLLSAPDGSTIEGMPAVDLTAVDELGRFPRTVATVIDPAAHGINVPRLLLLG